VDDSITLSVAVQIVDHLEVVEIHIGQGQFVIVASGTPHFGFRFLMECSPVEKPGEMVDPCRVTFLDQGRLQRS